MFWNDLDPNEILELLNEIKELVWSDDDPEDIVCALQDMLGPDEDDDDDTNY